MELPLPDPAPAEQPEAPPDLAGGSTWTEALPKLRAEWERHLQQWPPAETALADRTADEPGSWRGEDGQYLNAEQNMVADHALERVRAAEAGVSRTLHSIESAIPGARLVGLEHCLKGEERFKEKIADELSTKPDRSMAEVTGRMPDAMRYTFEVNVENYVESYWQRCDALARCGYEMLLSRNSWQIPDYKGINTRWLTPDKQIFEVQFHTPESYQAKQLTHHAYERLRIGSASGAERPDLELFQQSVSSHVPNPDGVAEIPDYRREGY